MTEASPPCRVCHSNKDVLSYPDDHSQTICPTCCVKATHANGETGHEIIYERGNGHFCAHCGEAASDEWHHDHAESMAENDAEREAGR